MEEILKNSAIFAMRLHWNFYTLQEAFNYLDMYLSINRSNHRDYLRIT